MARAAAPVRRHSAAQRAVASVAALAAVALLALVGRGVVSGCVDAAVPNTIYWDSRLQLRGTRHPPPACLLRRLQVSQPRGSAIVQDAGTAGRLYQLAKESSDAADFVARLRQAGLMEGAGQQAGGGGGGVAQPDGGGGKPSSSGSGGSATGTAKQLPVPQLSRELAHAHARGGTIIVTCECCLSPPLSPVPAPLARCAALSRRTPVPSQTGANAHFSDFVLNWVHHVRSHGIDNYLVGAMDRETGQVGMWWGAGQAWLPALRCGACLAVASCCATAPRRGDASTLPPLVPCACRRRHWRAAACPCLQCMTRRRGRPTRGWAPPTLGGAAPPSTKWGGRRWAGRRVGGGGAWAHGAHRRRACRRSV